MRNTIHSIKTRLLLIFLIPFLLFVVGSFHLLNNLSSTVDRLSDRLYGRGTAVMELLLNGDRDLYQALTGYMSLTLKPENSGKREEDLAFYKENLGQAKERIASARELIEQNGLQDLKYDENGKTLGEIMNAIESGLADWEKLSKTGIEHPSGEPSEIDAVFDTARNGIDQAQEIVKKYQEQTIQDEKEAAKSLATFIYFGLGGLWVLLAVLGIFVIRRLHRTIERVRWKTHRVSEGFLDPPESIRYGKDELGKIQKDVDDMVIRMRDMIGEIMNNSRAVSAATGELAASVLESSKASSHVAANIQEVTGLVEVQANITSETSKAIGEMTIGVQRIAESAGTIAAHAGDTHARAQQGNEQLMQLKQQLDVLVGEISRLADTIKVLNDKSAEIGAITENITGFANQTNILSLNASIEAAHAGEHGRGFAVVAGEIRKLAASSLQSADNINRLVEETLREIGNAGERMQATVEQVERSMALMEKVDEDFQAITASIQHVSEQIHEMSSVTEEMSATSEEVSASMEHAASSIREVSGKAENVAAATEEQLAHVETISRSADQLRNVVENLNKAVGYFKI